MSKNNFPDSPCPDKGPLIDKAAAAKMTDGDFEAEDGTGKIKAETFTTTVKKQLLQAAPESSDEDDADVDVDADADADGDSTQRFRIDSGLLPFPEKLMALLDGNTVLDAMWWLPDGDAFCIIPAVFAEQVLDKHFSGTKFESFTRKLNRCVVGLVVVVQPL